MHWQQPIQYGSISDIGFRRQNNQDSSLVKVCSDEESFRAHGHLFLVADGMGGHAVGELASKMAVDALPQSYYKSKAASPGAALREAIQVANGAIFERGTANHEFDRMGTTCSALVLSRHGAVIGHVGDSRCYRIRGSRIDQLTSDHSLQWELMRHGQLKPEDVAASHPKHVITRSLGPEREVEVDIEGPHPIAPRDTYVLCSDGLTGHLSDPEIGMIVSELPPGDACRLLVNLANLRGGADNITVVVSRVGDLPEGATALEPEPHPQHSGIAWGWLAAIWILSILLVAGFTSSMFGSYVVNLTAMILASLLIIGLLVVWLRHRRKQRENAAESDEPSLDETTVWRPYRTASAKLTPDFVKHLAEIDSELNRAARDENWTVDWTRHGQAAESARQAIGARDYSLALKALADSIDVFVAGIHRQRKRDVKPSGSGAGGPKQPKR